MAWLGEAPMSANLRDVLMGIYTAHGALTPQIVLDEARDPEHPLHHRFEWDDAVAAEKWRREQAHELIQSVRIGYRKASGDFSDVRAFHAIRRPNGTVYEPAEHVVRDEVASRILLQDMEREWRQLKQRYETFEQFWRMVQSDAQAA